MKKFLDIFALMIVSVFGFISCATTVQDTKLCECMKKTLQNEELNTSKQIIVVKTPKCPKAKKEGILDKTFAKILLIEKDENNNLKVVDTFIGRVGKNGISDTKKEGDGKTPLGIYSISSAFGKHDITPKIPYRKLEGNEYFVDDVKSKFYNTMVIKKDDEKITWNSAEYLNGYPVEYEYALVIDYNTSPIVKGKGSAIFFHVENNKATSGCIATSKKKMKEIFNWIDKSKNPKIVITK